MKGTWCVTFHQAPLLIVGSTGTVGADAGVRTCLISNISLHREIAHPVSPYAYVRLSAVIQMFVSQ